MEEFSSASSFGFLCFLAVASLILWQYLGKEKRHDNFLEDRIRDYHEEKQRNKSKRIEKLEKQLVDLFSPYKAEDLVSKSYVLCAVIFAMGLALDILPIALLLAVISLGLPEIYCKLRKDKLDKEFERQLPDNIDSLLAIIRAGMTPVQGYKMLAEEASFPSSHEFRKIYTDIKTGASQEKALSDFYERHPINDIKLFMTGMVIAAEATPAVAINTLKTISMTIHMRKSQKQSAKSAIMQGKYAAIIMSLVPVISLAVMLTFMPDYMAPMMENDIGKIAIVFALIWDAIGYYVANRITSSDKLVKY